MPLGSDRESKKRAKDSESTLRAVFDLMAKHLAEIALLILFRALVLVHRKVRSGQTEIANHHDFARAIQGIHSQSQRMAKEFRIPLDEDLSEDPDLAQEPEPSDDAGSSRLKDQKEVFQEADKHAEQFGQKPLNEEMAEKLQEKAEQKQRKFGADGNEPGMP